MSNFFFLYEHWKIIVFGLVIIAVVLPFISVFTNVFSILTPFLTAISQFIVWFIEELIEGAKVVFTSFAAIVLIVTISCGVSLYIHAVDAVELDRRITNQKEFDKQMYSCKPKGALKRYKTN